MVFFLEQSLTAAIASAWNGYNLAHGTVTVHSFNDGPEDEGDQATPKHTNESLQPTAWHISNDESS